MSVFPSPSPRRAADELLWHITLCHECMAAKMFRTNQHCETGKKLIRLTLDERHGPRDDE